jgi:(2Fe-2S) ferredoxin
VNQKPEKYVFVCTNTRPDGHPRGSCTTRGSADVFQALREVQGDRNAANFKVVATGCLEPCLTGPTIVVYPDNVWYGGVTVDDVEQLVDQHLIGGQPVEFLTITDEEFEAAQRGPKAAPPTL